MNDIGKGLASLGLCGLAGFLEYTGKGDRWFLLYLVGK